MRSKKFVCKMTAAFLSAAMIVASAPMYGQTWVSAAEREQAQGEFEFGSANTKLSAGEYVLPVTLMRGADISQASMAGSCVKGGKLTVNSDGTADITVYLQAVTVMGISGWASDWNIYTETLDGEKEAAAFTQDEGGNVDSITFCLPENTMDGVYTDMYISVMQSVQQAYFAFDFASLAQDGDETTAEQKSGSAKVEQFGGYDVNVEVSVLNSKITDLKIEGANFEGSYVEINQSKLQEAADGMQPSYIGRSATDVKEIEGVDAVSGATYSSDAIRSAVIDALGLTPSSEIITLPTEKLDEGIYQVDIAFYTDGVKHSLVENDKAKAVITVDDKGNMTLTTAIINGTAKEPLYVYAFNGYYEGNHAENTLKSLDQVKKEDITYTDDVFGADEKVVTEVTFPLEGEFAETYLTNASIYVPAMKNLTGELEGITFEQGRFSADCYAKIYWDSLKKSGNESGFGSAGIALEEGVYTLPLSMKNAADISKDSMAGACLKGAALTVKEDGSATVTVDLTSVTVMGQTAWSSDWKIYQGQSTDSEAVDAEVTKTDAYGNVTQIAFTLPNNQADGVYVNMSSGGHANNAYLAFDFANAEKQEKDPDNALEDGIYLVDGTMFKPDLKTKSMADSAFNHNIMMTVEDGKATLTLNFKGMEITGIYGYLGSLKYFDTGYQKDTYGNPTGTLKNVNVKSVQKYSDGVIISDDFGTDYPDVVSFEVIPEALKDGIVPLQVFVPIMESITAGTGNQNVYLSLDIDYLEKTTAEDERFSETEVAPENPNKPTEPETPNKPTEPEIPNKPTNPETPNKPTNSGNTNQSTNTGNTNTSAGSNSQENSGGTTTPVTIKAGKTVKVNRHTYKVTAKGKVAFTKCKANAKTVAIPATIKIKGVTHKVTSIAKNAFKNNKKLTKVTVGKNVTKVGTNAFKGCTKLKTVKLASSITKKKKTALKKLLKKAGVSAKAIK